MTFPIVAVVFALLVHLNITLGVKGFNINACVSMAKVPEARKRWFPRLCSTMLSSSVVHRLELLDNFNRWRFLQNLLDEDVDVEDINELLYIVLSVYRYTHGDIHFADDIDLSAPEPTPELIQVVDNLLKVNGSIPLFQSPDFKCQNKDLLLEMEKLLPDPVENEDAFKGTWDTIMELHGKASVAYNEREGRTEWKLACLVARLLIYFEFMTGERLDDVGTILGKGTR